MSKLHKWQLVASEDISPSKWFPLVRNTYTLPNRKHIDDFYIAKLGEVAMIVPILTTGEIVFVRQYKPGIDGIVTELPAGIIKVSQTPLEAAKAELKEETGGVAKEMRLLGTLFNLPTKSSVKVHIFLAEGVALTAPQELDETEDIEMVRIPVGQVEYKIKQGLINCSDTIAALSLARLKRPDIFG